MAFKMKGHTLPGINQRGNKGMKDGRANSSPFQQGEGEGKKFTKTVGKLERAKPMETPGKPMMTKKMEKLEKGKRYTPKPNVPDVPRQAPKKAGVEAAKKSAKRAGAELSAEAAQAAASGALTGGKMKKPPKKIVAEKPVKKETKSTEKPKNTWQSTVDTKRKAGIGYTSGVKGGKTGITFDDGTWLAD